MPFSLNSLFVKKYSTFELQTAHKQDRERFVRNLLFRLNETAYAINNRRFGSRTLTAEANGESYAPDPTGTDPTPTFVMEHTYYDGPLANGGALSIAHDITWASGTQIIAIDAWATDPNNSYSIPLPYVDVSSTPVTGNIELYIDNTNIVITSAGDATNFTLVKVTLRWIEE